LAYARLEGDFTIVPQRIKITVLRQNEAVMAVKISSIFGEATLSRQELAEMLAALQPDLTYDHQTIRLKPGLTRARIHA
jgi:hypothetical protein